MKAIDRHFTKIINGTTQFVIPVFQRDYSWSEAQCDQLWRDVLEVAADTTDRGHFLGSVVYVSTGDSSAGFTRWLLIDGQQRVTTLTILLAALRDHIRSTRWTGTEDGPTEARLEAYFLKNVQEEGGRRYKLVLRRHDDATLRWLLDGGEPPGVVSERLRENYEFFRERLADADPEVVYRGIGRIVVVDVTLARGIDDPQLIFESLNSTGMDLSQSDLIRNFILMRLPEREQTRMYDNYWCKIETLFRGSERVFDAFTRDYLALRTEVSKQEKTDEIYFAFRRVFGSIGSEPARLDEVLAEMLRYARHHAAFSIGADTTSALREPLARVRRLVDVPAILIMQLYHCHETLGTLTESEFVEALRLIESYVFRRAICGEQTRSYWQVFANLAYRIEAARPLEALKVGLARLRDSYRFPSDADFRSALEESDVYHKQVCFLLLDSLENHGSKEPTDTSPYSIEHVMPQNENLGREWRAMLGDEWRAVQMEWLHRLGNLTLTGYNSTYSDRPFEEKKTIPGGFADSSIRLNRFVREQGSWTRSEMERRGKDLAGQALAIWPPLAVDKALIAAAEQADMKALAKRRDVGKVPMSATARTLFELLRVAVKELHPDIIELAEPKSVSYHGPAFFLEILPRKNRINLLLPLDFSDLQDPSGLAQDATEWKFFVNATHQGGVFARVESEADVPKVLPLIRQALARARE